MGAIAERLEKARRRVADAADVAGRDPADVLLVAVTKTVGVEEVRQAVAAGCHDFGENRVQEFLGKHGLFPAERWHFIGTLQSNKARDVVGRAHLIHSIDSMKLLQAVDRHAREKGVVQPVLLQANVAAEESKHGFDPADLPDALRAACDMPGLEVRGLMTMAPLVGRQDEVRWVFRELRELLEGLQAMHIGHHDLTELSMGMTNDFEVAVEEGATIVRVGRAIFGK
jgi:pyridoxal phosphate enzyme (YggS family)